MPYLLRKIRKARWSPELREEFGPFEEHDCPADCVADLGTSGCRLSLWEIHDDRSNLGEVIVALAANTDRLSNLDYALIPREKIEEIALLEVTEGQTAHIQANQKWHRDLVGLSGRRLIDVASLIFSTAERRRVLEKDVSHMVQEALEKERLDPARVRVAIWASVLSESHEDAAMSAKSAAIVRENDARVLHAFGEKVTILLDGKRTDGKLTMWMEITPPGGGPPPHYHLNEDEAFHVLEGRVAFLVNDEWHEVGPGGAVFMPRGVVHTFKNVGDQPSRMLLTTQPSGFEKFFARCAVEFAKPGGPNMSRIIDVGVEHEFISRRTSKR
jgi:quercetin dioxygenase-like cupin family protein